MAQAGVGQSQLRELTRTVGTKRIRLSERGEEKLTGAAFFQVMGIGLLLFVTLSSYGGAMFSAVVQEKESRLVEILFSSVRPFTLLLGKLIGVSLVAFTQYAIWIGAFLILTLYGANAIGTKDTNVGLVSLPASFFLYLVSFFLVGFFIFATVYTVVGAMMNERDDNSSLSLLASTPLLIAFSMAMPVMRSPNSWMETIASFIPFFSPVLMPIRIIAQQPPAWQIVLSLLLGIVAILILLRLAAIVYRTGMLMHGKKISIPEVMRWVRQA